MSQKREIANTQARLYLLGKGPVFGAVFKNVFFSQFAGQKFLASGLCRFKIHLKVIVAAKNITQNLNF